MGLGSREGSSDGRAMMHAAILNDVDACGDELLRGRVVADAELQPHCLRRRVKRDELIHVIDDVWSFGGEDDDGIDRAGLLEYLAYDGAIEDASSLRGSRPAPARCRRRASDEIFRGTASRQS